MRLGVAGYQGMPLALEERLTDTVPVVGVGVDLSVRLGRRVTAVPSMRLLYLVDEDRTPSGVSRRAVSNVIVATGLGLAIGF